MEYRITTSEIPALCEDAEKRTGLLMHIRPPIDLNPDAVERYLLHNDLEPVVTRSHPNSDVNDVLVLGSTTEQTTIYASLANTSEGYADIIREEATTHMVEFLKFMGAHAIVE